MNTNTKKGLFAGFSIGLGYFFTAIGLGLYASQNNIDVIPSTALAITSLSSTGSMMGLKIMAEMGTFTEMAMTQFIINLRYSLLSISLSQKLPSDVKLWQKAIIAFGNTDENFAVAIHEEKLTARFFFTLMIIPIIGWTLGTYCGTIFGNFLPDKLKTALGILIYAMLIAIITPDAKKEKAILFSIIAAALLHSLIYYKIPVITSGFAVIITSIAISVIAAVFFPVKSEERA